MNKTTQRMILTVGLAVGAVAVMNRFDQTRSLINGDQGGDSSWWNPLGYF